MIKKIYITTTIISIMSLFLYAYSNIKIKNNNESLNNNNKISVGNYSDENSPLNKKIDAYEYGDWDKYILDPLSKKFNYNANNNDDDINIISYGSMKLNLIYGKSFFTDKKYKLFDEDKPVSKLIKQGFIPEQEMQLHIEGTIGKRLTLYIDHDSNRKDNFYKMAYRAINDDEIIREINAGDIDIKFENSKYAVYDNNSAKGIGLDITLKKNKFQLKGFGSIIKGKTEIEYFKGNSSPEGNSIPEYQFVKRKYYQLEPFKRYDNISTVSSLTTGINAYNNLTLFTSMKSETYKLNPVYIDPAEFELYLDDQNPYNDYNAIKLNNISGLYTKLSKGKDYSINYSTGLITFIRNIAANEKIFAAYKLSSGKTSDPGALVEGDTYHPGDKFPGRIIVFIKFGYSINEDLNKNLILDPGEDIKINDGKLNLDIYEVRSFYNIGNKQILPGNFKINFYYENKILSTDNISSIGKFSIDYTNGIVNFIYREPFKNLISTNISQDNADKIYSEYQIQNIEQNSRYKIRLDYFREARSFQLKNFNIIPDSIKIKIDNREILPTLYSIDCISGFLIFTDPNNPIIGPETEIEIKYEYMPMGNISNKFVGGIRADYEFNKGLNIGGTLLLSKSSTGEMIPNLDNPPEQNLIIESDIKIDLNERRLGKLANLITKKKIKKIPAKITLYGEYARSYYNVNTFGKGLIDNMESSNLITGISLSEKDWILSSMPQGKVESDRGELYYYFYRKPSNPTALQGISFSPTEINYSVKPGPFNIATGHIDSSIQSNTSQRSLVLDFDMKTGNTLSIVTQNLSENVLDFSGLQYIEIWYKYEGSSNIELSFDLGIINEDSDGDGFLDTEDINVNGILDINPNSGLSEDIGYNFNNITKIGSGPNLNSMTMGDGILNTEDLNHNGLLDTPENIYKISGISIAGGITDWQKQRIYINKNSTEYLSALDLLKQIKSIRLNLSGNNNDKGRILIDQINFISSRWIDLKINETVATPSELTLTMINSINDSDYRTESFIYSNPSLYKNLYGEKSNDELDKELETALQLEYNITSGDNVSIKRKFLNKLDFHNYKAMNLWVNYQNFTGDEHIGIIIASSDNDFIEYNIETNFKKTWRELKLKLNKNSNGEYDISKSSGAIDLKRIKYIKIIIYGAPGDTGKIWINEIYLSEPNILKENAHLFQGEVEITKPLYKLKSGVPVLSDIKIKYIEKGHGRSFATIGKIKNNLEEKKRQLYTSASILPQWNIQVDYFQEEYDTDSLNEEVDENLRGNTEKKIVYLKSDYKSKNRFIPDINFSYNYKNNINNRKEIVSDISFNKIDEKNIYAPILILHKKINDFLWGELSGKVLLNMIFTDNNIERKSNDDNLLSSYLTLKEKEKKQKTNTNININYNNKYLFFQNDLSVGSEEFIKLDGLNNNSISGVITDVESRYHLPLLYNDDIKFIERNKQFKFRAGSTGLKYFSPDYNFNLNYYENKFFDLENEDSIKYNYSRMKDARSSAQTQINFPINFYKIKKTNFIKRFNLSFNRSVDLFENNIPYEGESYSIFEEKYGIKRSLNKVSNSGLNVIKYYPGYFFKGRNNYASGRDYLYKNYNSSITFEDGSSVDDYTNHFRIINNLSFDASLEFKAININSNMGINQVNERQNISGIPRQILTKNLSLLFNFDLMKLLNFGFFRKNKTGEPFHSSNIDAGFDYNNNMLITSNILENTFGPNIGTMFKIDRLTFGIKFSLEYRIKKNKNYFSNNSDEDDIYLMNIPENNIFSEKDKGYKFSFLFETDVKWLYNIFLDYYKLTALPIFTIEYSLQLNKYDYTKTVSPEPADMHIATGKLTMDLHKNVQGGISSRWIMERLRNRETKEINREIISYEIAANFSLLF